MPEFTATQLLDDELSVRFRRVLDALIAFDRHCQQVSAEPSTEAQRAAMREHLDGLLALAQSDLSPGGMPIDPATARRAFGIGVRLLAHYESTVVGDLPLIDTLGSKTLRHFEVDLANASAHEDHLRRALRRCGLDDSDHQGIDQFVAHELEQLDLRHRLIVAMEAVCPLEPPTQTAVFALFSLLFPGHPLHPDELELIRTATSLFFSTPFHPERVRDLPDERRASVEDFLDRIYSFEQSQLGHFPVFGCFRGDQADPDFVDQLAEQVGVSSAAVQSALTTMVTVLRSSEIDQYIVHDTWGHLWQAQLLPYEHDYENVAQDRLPPQMDVPVHLPGQPAITLREALSGDQADMRTWVRAECARRLHDAMSAVVAEILADLVEYKFLVASPQHRALMPSSSLFGDRPTKLDLSLVDLRSMHKLAFSGLKQFGEPRPDDSPALHEMRAQVRDVLAGEFAAEWLAEAHPQGGVRVNPYTRVGLNILGLHSALTMHYSRAMARTCDIPEPLQDVKDLVVLSVGAFHQLDPGRHLWHLDEFISLHFPALLERFLDALEATASVASGGQ